MHFEYGLSFLPWQTEYSAMGDWWRAGCWDWGDFRLDSAPDLQRRKRRKKVTVGSFIRFVGISSCPIVDSREVLGARRQLDDSASHGLVWMRCYVTPVVRFTQHKQYLRLEGFAHGSPSQHVWEVSTNSTRVLKRRKSAAEPACKIQVFVK